MRPTNESDRITNTTKLEKYFIKNRIGTREIEKEKGSRLKSQRDAARFARAARVFDSGRWDRSFHQRRAAEPLRPPPPPPPNHHRTTAIATGLEAPRAVRQTRPPLGHLLHSLALLAVSRTSGALEFGRRHASSTKPPRLPMSGLDSPSRRTRTRS